MSAAVARPPLFGHLVASRPDREDGSLRATIASVAIHSAFIAAAVALSTRVIAPAPPAVERPVILIAPPKPIERTATPQTPGGGGGTGQAALEAPQFPSPIGEIPWEIPKPGIVVQPFDGRLPLAPGKPVPGPIGGGGDPGAPGNFTIVTRLPSLLNRAEVERAMTRLYPNILLHAGIGGIPIVWLRLDEEGRVVQTQLKKSSGHTALDDAALEVGKRARFSPAYNGDSRVRVWVELPVVFQARN